MNFAEDFELLTGHAPFPWQAALYGRMVDGAVPTACGLPTGLGKTSVMAVWLLALIANPKLPRRLVYVVNRRTVVDQATHEVECMAARLMSAESAHLHSLLAAMPAIATEPGASPLIISTLRGERADNGLWRRDPAAPAVVVGTVDMIGSRLLFSGYGSGYKTRPMHAGLLGQDTLLVHDEAHLEPAFQELLLAIQCEQERNQEARSIRVMALTATGRTQADFQLCEHDLAHPVVHARLHARKGLRVHQVSHAKELPARMADQAKSLAGAIIVFLSRVEHAQACAARLRKGPGKPQVLLLTGTMRGQERDDLVRSPVFARFQPRPAPGTSPADGTVFLVATAAGEVGIDISADHLVTDLPPFDSLAQRLGRVNRFGAGDAWVEVFCEPIKAAAPVPNEADDDANEEAPTLARQELYELARLSTQRLIDQLPLREDQRRDASPLALGQLPQALRDAAATPMPTVRAVDGLLFDRWSYTTLQYPLPGRPPVQEWLHGQAEWEPPRTWLAWRSEVAWLTPGHLGDDTLADFLADYPLRSRELLNDLTQRVMAALMALHERNPHDCKAWLVTADGASFWALGELLQRYPKARPWPDGAMLILEPRAGGLSSGLLDAAATYDTAASVPYDLGPHVGERLVDDGGDTMAVPPGMRLVRAIRRNADDDAPVWWRLYASSQSADDDGSRSSRYLQTLSFHLGRTEHWARRICASLGLPPWQRKAIEFAAQAHDLGKARRVWQRSIKNHAEPWLAKGPMQPALLGNYRHELGSLHDMRAAPAFSTLSEQEQDLAQHLVAAHHGRARPHFPPHEANDVEVAQATVAELVAEVPLRFERLQRELGRWHLAWLEALLRAADALASDDEQEAT